MDLKDLMNAIGGASGGFSSSSPRSRRPPTQRTMSIIGQVTPNTGDPNFSRTRAGTQEQVPQAAAQYDLLLNQNRARKVRELYARLGLKVPDEVAEIEEAGFTERKPSVFENVLRALDAPRRVVNLAIQDISAGPEEAQGFSSPDFNDYTKALMGQDTEVVLRTGHNPSSGSETLALWGWDEADTGGEKFGRGVADFVLQVASDPLTYLTFGASALGKRALGFGADATVQRITREAISGVGDTALHSRLAGRYRELYNEAMQSLSEQTDNLVRNALDAGDSVVFRELEAQAAEAAKLGLRREARNEVIGPVVTRDFGAESLQEWVPFLPAYATGGARIAFPFSQSMLAHGITIPGTRGLGRRLVGDRFRSMIASGNKNGVTGPLMRTLSSVADNLDKGRPLLRGLKEGSMDAHTWLTLTNAESNSRLAGHVTEVGARMGHYANEIVKEVDARDVETVRSMHTGLARYVTTGVSSEIDELAPAGSRARQQIDEFRLWVNREATRMWDMMKDAAPDLRLGKLENYVPMSVNRDMHKFLEELASSPAYLKYADAAGSGPEAAGVWYLSKVLDALGRGGRSEAAIGSNRNLLNRDLDLAMRLNDETLSLVWGNDALTVGSPSLPAAVANLVEAVTPDRLGFVQLNDFIEPVLKKLIDEFGLKMKVPRTGLRVFDEDVFRVMTDYVSSMSSTIASRDVLRYLEEEGLILAKPWVLNEQSTLAHIAARVQDPKIIKWVERAQKQQDERFGNAAIRELDKVRASGKLPSYGATRRAELSTYGPGLTETVHGPGGDVVFGGHPGWQRLYVEPRRLEDPAYRARYLLDEVGVGEPLTTPGQVRPFMWLGGPDPDRWEAFYSVADDAFLPSVVLTDDAVLRTIGQGRLARLQFADNVATLYKPEAARTIDGLETGPLIEQRAIEFLHAHDRATFMQNTPISKDGILRAGEQQDLSKIIKELDDEGAYLSMWDYTGSVLYGENAVEQFEAGQTLITKVADAVRRRHKQYRAGFVPDERQFKQFFGSDFVDDETVKVYGQLSNRADQAVEIPVRDVHGVVYMYHQPSGKRFIRFAGGDTHRAAMQRLANDINKVFPDTISKEDILIGGGSVLDSQAMKDAGFWYFHGENRPYDVTDLSRGRLGREQSFRWLHGPGVPPAIMEEADGIGLRLAEKMGHDIYRATPWISNDSRVLRVSDNIWDPSKMDDLDVYNLVFETMRKIQDAPTLAQARIAAQTSKIGNDPELLGQLAERTGRTAAAGETTAEWAARIPNERAAQRVAGEQTVLGQPEQRGLANMFEARGTEWIAKTVKNHFTRTYGPELTAAVRKTTKELEEFDTTAEDFVNTLLTMFDRSLDAQGNIKLSTRFVSKQGDEVGLPAWLKQIEEYGEALGINPKTWEADWEYSSLLDPKITKDRNFVDPSLFNIGGGPLEAKMVQADVNKWLEQLVRNMSSIYTPQGIAQLKATTGAVTRIWKTMTTITRPTFHIRNLLGGVWNNQIVGVRLRDYAQVNTGMVSIRRALRAGKNMDVALSSVNNPQTRDMFRAAWNSGLLDLSFSRAEFRALSNAERTAMARRVALVNPLTTDPENFLLARAGGLFMESIEDFMRVSAFARWFDPSDVENSAKVAKEMSLAVHFDYKNLTEFETMVKKFIPFFVWQRRNLPLQLQMMVERPGLMNRYQHMMLAAQEQFAPIEEDQYAQSDFLSSFAVGTDIVLNDNTPFWARIMVDPDVPVKDLFELGSFAPEEILSYFLDSLGPTYSFAQDFLEQRDFGPVNAPAPMNAVLAQLARSGLYDKSADGDVQIPYMARTIYNLLFPYAQEYEDILAPVDPRRQQGVGQGQDDSNLDSILSRLGMTLGRGVGIQAQTPSQTPGAAFGAAEQLDRIIGSDFRAGKIPQDVYDEVFG